MPESPRLVFMGTPDFAVPSLDALVDAGHKPVAVVTVPDKPAGRGRKLRSSAVKDAAVRHGLLVLQPENLRDKAFQTELAALKPDIMAVVAFRILPEAVYSLARLGAFNLHGSLLPAYRGAAPIQRALMDGVSETGVTTFLLQPKVDTGDVILSRRIDVGLNDNAGDIHDRLAEIGADAVVETVQLLAAGIAPSQSQDDTLASAAPKVFRDDAEIRWNRSAADVHNHIRALSPFPGAWTTWQGETLKILRTTRTDMRGPAQAGGFVVDDGHLVVSCGEGAVELLEVQREGKRRMDVPTFLRGADFPDTGTLGS